MARPARDGRQWRDARQHIEAALELIESLRTRRVEPRLARVIRREQA